MNTEIDRISVPVQTVENGHIGPEDRHRMDKQHLQGMIEKLHRELASTDSIDDDSRALLQELAQDVEKLAGSTESSTEKHGTTTGQLQNAAVKFESEHPKLSMALGEVIDALGKLGI